MSIRVKGRETDVLDEVDPAGTERDIELELTVIEVAAAVLELVLFDRVYWELEVDNTVDDGSFVEVWVSVDADGVCKSFPDVDSASVSVGNVTTWLVEGIVVPVSTVDEVRDVKSVELADSLLEDVEVRDDTSLPASDVDKDAAELVNSASVDEIGDNVLDSSFLNNLEVALSSSSLFILLVC